MGPKRRSTTKSATLGGGKRTKSNNTCARSQDSKKQTKRCMTQPGRKKQSYTSSSSSELEDLSASMRPRIDEVHCRLSKLIERAKEHMEMGRRLSEEWVSCEAEVEDLQDLITTKVDDDRLLNLRAQLDEVNTIMSGEFSASDDSSNGF